MSWFKSFQQRHLTSWLDKRVPKQTKHQLNKNNIFILPNGAGFAFLSSWVAVYLLATNYQNNLMLLFTYWLLAIFLLVMLLSFLNLYGLAICCDSADDSVSKQIKAHQIIHLGQNANLLVQVHTLKKRYNLYWQDDLATYTPQITESDKFVQLAWQPTKRGVFNIPRFKLSTNAPLGWFNVWCYLNFVAKIWVCPKPVACPQYLQGTKQTQQTKSMLFADEFSHLSNYRLGDSPSRIMWKKMLPERPLQVKRFVGEQSEQIKYSFYDLTGDLEDKLGCLTWLVMQAHQNNWLYQLDLPQQQLTANRTEQQYLTMLQAIAMVGGEHD